MRVPDIRLIEKESIITARKLVEKERKELLDAPNKPDFESWLGNREYPLKWMKKQYGKTLREKDGLTYPNGERYDNTDCNVCGKKVNPDEKVVHFSFSFCNEYSCGMNICEDCLVRLKKLITKSKTQEVQKWQVNQKSDSDLKHGKIYESD